MPEYQTLLGKLNRLFSRPDVIETRERRELFAPGKRLRDAAQGLGVMPSGASANWLAFLDLIPESLHEAIRAIVYSALSAKDPVEVTLSWAPGYDYELTVWQAPDTASTRGGITLLIRTRYPGDPHPIGGDGESKKRERR